MNGESDILFLVRTSHGSPDGLAVTAGRRAETLKPSTLAEMLERTGVRRKVVVISACYSGVFIPRLANADTLVITAADANHASFGCEDKAKWFRRCVFQHRSSPNEDPERSLPSCPHACIEARTAPGL